MEELIEQGVLARPVFVWFDTGVAIDRALKKAERGLIDPPGDLSRGLLNRLARHERRNAAVVDHYLKHRAKYGQTLIFAVDIEQCVQLVRRLQKAGVRADYVASSRRDDRSNDKVLSRFRSGKLNVVISAVLLTEGVDLPAARTVIAARPTTSATLLSQMFGRALRGPKVGGTDEAYLVALRDDWSRFPTLEGQLDRVPLLVGLVPSLPPARRAARPVDPAVPSVEIIADRIRQVLPPQVTESYESVASRWYVMFEPDSGRPRPGAIVVYGHVLAAWEAVLTYIGQLDEANLAAADVATLASQFFPKGEAAAPPERDLRRLLDHIRRGGTRPVAFGPEDRRACDPHALAAQIADGDLGERARCELVEARYTPLAQALHSTLRDYWAAVNDAILDLRSTAVISPDDAPQPVSEVASGQGTAGKRIRAGEPGRRELGHLPDRATTRTTGPTASSKRRLPVLS